MSSYHVGEFALTGAQAQSFYQNPLIKEWQVVDNATRSKVFNAAVRVFQWGDQYMIESEIGGQIIRQDLGMTGWSPEAVTEKLSVFRPYIQADGTIEFVKRIQSLFNKDVTIDARSWAVALVSTGDSQSNPLAWLGHAVVLIETFENGQYYVWYADAREGVRTSSCGDTLLMVKLFEVKDLNEFLKDRSNLPRSDTWVRAKALVERMLRKIQEERDDYDNRVANTGAAQEYSQRFALLGGDPSSGSYNCLEWSRDKLAMIGIHLPQVPCMSTVVAAPLPITRLANYEERRHAEEGARIAGNVGWGMGAVAAFAPAAAAISPVGGPIALGVGTLGYGLVLASDAFRGRFRDIQRSYRDWVPRIADQEYAVLET